MSAFGGCELANNLVQDKNLQPKLFPPAKNGPYVCAALTGIVEATGFSNRRYQRTAGIWSGVKAYTHRAEILHNPFTLGENRQIMVV